MAAKPVMTTPMATAPHRARVRFRLRGRHFRHAQMWRALVSLLVVGALLGSLVSPLGAPVPVEAQSFSQQATLTVSSPPVEVQRSSGSRDSATGGTTVNVGDRVFTGPGGAARLTFFQGSEVEIGESSEIMVQQMDQKPGGATTVGIGQAVGSTFSKVASLFNPASRFQVNTPSAVAVVRGTNLAIKQLANGITTYTCVTGECEVKSGGKTVTLKQGESTFVLPPAPAPTGVPSSRTTGGKTDPQPTEEAPVPALSTAELGNALATAEGTAAARATATPGPSGTPGPSSTPGPSRHGWWPSASGSRPRSTPPAPRRTPARSRRTCCGCA